MYSGLVVALTLKKFKIQFCIRKCYKFTCKFTIFQLQILLYMQQDCMKHFFKIVKMMSATMITHHQNVFALSKIWHRHTQAHYSNVYCSVCSGRHTQAHYSNVYCSVCSGMPGIGTPRLTTPMSTVLYVRVGTPRLTTPMSTVLYVRVCLA